MLSVRRRTSRTKEQNSGRCYCNWRYNCHGGHATSCVAQCQAMARTHRKSGGSRSNHRPPDYDEAARREGNLATTCDRRYEKPGIDARQIDEGSVQHSRSARLAFHHPSSINPALSICLSILAASSLLPSGNGVAGPPRTVAIGSKAESAERSDATTEASVMSASSESTAYRTESTASSTHTFCASAIAQSGVPTAPAGWDSTMTSNFAASIRRV
eukprot:scaffold80557_cov31-Tisochrysis_lutea.AAC.5